MYNKNIQKLNEIVPGYSGSQINDLRRAERQSNLINNFNRNLFGICCLLIISIVILSGCESNDAPNNSVYIPQPVNRKILVELFTNAGCLPCVQVHNYFDQIHSQAGATINDSSVVFISYHWRSPNPADSLYIQNRQQNNDRAAYYGVFATPFVFMDGTQLGQFSGPEYSTQFGIEMNTTEYLDIGMSNVFDSTSDSGRVTLDILTVAPIPASDLKLHVIISESDIHYTLTNGITLFHDVVRTMVTGAPGEDISLGPETIVDVDYGLNTRWVPSNCKILAFIQSASTKKVYGVETLKIR